MKKIEIACNRKVKNYTVNQVKSLTGLGVEKAYEMLKKENCLPVSESDNILKRGKKLMELIDSFKIPVSVPVRPVDERHIWQFTERWKKHLQGLIGKMVSASQPVYLVDEVNKQLKKRKSSIQCSRVQLMWYLDLYGDEKMSPETIAAAITKFGVTDWSKVQPLKNNAKYVLNLSDESIEVNQDEFMRLMEFMWKISKPTNQNKLLEKIQNDLKVLDDFIKLWESAPITYDYKKVFDDYVSRLQTIPPHKKRVLLKKENKIIELPEEKNYNLLKDFLTSIGNNSENDLSVIQENEEYIRAISQKENFNNIFSVIKYKISQSPTAISPLRATLGYIRHQI